jgi:V/A-type H+-transporting ATPase subunit I
MAVEPVKKIRVISHASLQEEVLEALQAAGTVHVERLSGTELLPPKEYSDEEQQSLRTCTFRISQAEFILSYLKAYGYDKRSFFRTIVKDKYPMTLEEFVRAHERVDLDRAYAECSEYERHLVEIDEKKTALEQEREELSNWTELQLDMDEIACKHMYCLLPLRVPVADLEAFGQALASEVIESTLDVVSERGSRAYCMVVYHLDSLGLVEEILTRLRVEKVTLPDVKLEPAERMEQVDREIAALERQREGLLARGQVYAGKRGDIEVLREYLLNQKRKLEALEQFGMTRSTVVVEGWVTEGEMEPTLENLEALSEEIGLEVIEADHEDSPPVSLRNGRFARPFELLVGLYGTPNRREYDPTWLVAVSFIVFFGFCIGDVGYGLVLVAACLLARRFLPLGEKVRNLLLVISYGSLFAMVIGALTGSWFGIDPASLPPLLETMAVFDPLRDPIPVMLLTMALGLAHMLSGTVVEFRDNVKEGNWVDALIDQGLVFLFFICLGVAIPLALAEVVPTSTAVLIGCAPIALMLLLLGRSAKSVPGKVINGVYETYNTVVGWMGDTISYLRLYALGLATFVIGWVVNTLAGMTLGIGPVIGVLLMLLILVVGQTFNVAINLLGAFVHPLRLEFVEFFGKFYEDGGQRFDALKYESKIVMIREEDA